MTKQNKIIDTLTKTQECIEKVKGQSTKIDLAAKTMIDAIRSGKKIIVFGNGGSASDASHIAAELVGRFKKNRHALPAISLATDTSILTAWSNDFSFEDVFARQVEAIAKNGDILLGLSTSGNSKNVLLAFKKGRSLGTYNISLTGNGGGQLVDESDLNINVKCNDTPRIQECHVAIYHILCEIIEGEFA